MGLYLRVARNQPGISMADMQDCRGYRLLPNRSKGNVPSSLFARVRGSLQGKSREVLECCQRMRRIVTKWNVQTWPNTTALCVLKRGIEQRSRAKRPVTAVYIGRDSR